MLKNGGFPPVQRGHLTSVDVDTRDGVPVLGEAHRSYQADVACSNNRNPHQRSSPPRFPRYHSSVLLSPSSSVTRGRYCSSRLALVMSGQRLLGLSTR